MYAKLTKIVYKYVFSNQQKFSKFHYYTNNFCLWQGSRIGLIIKKKDWGTNHSQLSMRVGESGEAMKLGQARQVEI